MEDTAQSQAGRLRKTGRRFDCTKDPAKTALDLREMALALLQLEYAIASSGDPKAAQRVRELTTRRIINPQTADGSVDPRGKALQGVLVKLLRCPDKNQKVLGMQVLAEVVRLRGSIEFAEDGKMFTGGHMRALLGKYLMWLKQKHGVHVELEYDVSTTALSSNDVLLLVTASPGLKAKLVPRD